ncbi:MAG: hypothetical protein AAF485_07185, partial [Chloroflexota bacterium]
MACEKNAIRCKIASSAAGISELGSRANNVAGATMVRMGQISDQADVAMDKAGQSMAPVTSLAMNVVAPSNKTKQAIGVATGTAITSISAASRLVPGGQAMMAKVVANTTTSGAKVAVGVAPLLGGAMLGIPKPSQKGRWLKLAAARVAGKLVPTLATAQMVVQISDATTGKLGSTVGALSKTGDAGEVTQAHKTLGMFKSEQKTVEPNLPVVASEICTTIWAVA